MSIAARLDDQGKAAWIILVIMSFVFFWPLALFILFYMIWSGRMGCWSKHRVNRLGLKSAGKTAGRWYNTGKSSGNRAFDDYKEATLRRLEEEQDEFLAFLERLRHSRDKAEFDQYMAERAQRGQDDAPPRDPQSPS